MLSPIQYLSRLVGKSAPHECAAEAQQVPLNSPLHKTFLKDHTASSQHSPKTSPLYAAYKANLKNIQKAVPEKAQGQIHTPTTFLQKTVKPLITIAKRVSFLVQRLLQNRNISLRFFVTVIDELKSCKKISPKEHKEVADLLAKNNAQQGLYSLLACLNIPSSKNSLLEGRTLLGTLEILYTSHLLEELTESPPTSHLLSSRDRKKLPNFNLSDQASEKTIHSQLQQLSSINARKTIYNWLNTLASLVDQEIAEETRASCIKALQENDIDAFTHHITSYLTPIEKGSLSAKTLYAKELLQFFSETPSFEALSHEIHLQSYIDDLSLNVSSEKNPSSSLISQIEKELTFAALQPVCRTHQASQKGSIAKTRRSIQEGGRDSNHVLFLTLPEDRRQKAQLLENILPSRGYTFSTRHIEQKATDTTPKIERIRDLLLQEQPDLINILSCNDVSIVATVAKKLGIPVINVSAGFDMTDASSSSDMRTVAPSTQDPISNSTIPPTVRKSDINEIGLLVGREFEKAYTSEQLSAFRKELSISQEQKVVVISCEGKSNKPDLVEKLISSYSKRDPSLHIIALCDDTYQEHSMREKVKKGLSNKPNLQFSTRSKINKEKEALLANIADLYITRPDEKKISRLYKAGTRTILDQRKPSHILNANVFVSQRRAFNLTETHRFAHLVNQEIQQHRHGPDAISRINASERYTNLTTELLASRRRDLLRSWYRS